MAFSVLSEKVIVGFGGRSFEDLLDELSDDNDELIDDELLDDELLDEERLGCGIIMTGGKVSGRSYNDSPECPSLDDDCGTMGVIGGGSSTDIDGSLMDSSAGTCCSPHDDSSNDHGGRVGVIGGKSISDDGG